MGNTSKEDDADQSSLEALRVEAGRWEERAKDLEQQLEKVLFKLEKLKVDNERLKLQNDYLKSDLVVHHQDYLKELLKRDRPD